MFLYKSIQYLFFPLNLSLFLLCLALFLLKKPRWQKMGYACVVFVVFLLTLSSFPFFALSLIHHMENKYTAREFKDYEKATAIVVLGGTTARRAAQIPEIEEVEGSRLVPAFRLFKLQKAPKILLSGGPSYHASNGEPRSEAQDMRDYLAEMGVPENAMWIEGKSRTTLENAEESSKILREFGAGPVLLVTSAFHIPRAVAAFEKYGIKTIPVPVAHLSPRTTLPLWQHYPNGQALFFTTIALKEILGLGWYRLTSR